MQNKKNIYIALVLIFFVILFLFLFKEKEIELDRAITVAAFGDSLTAGAGVSVQDSYPSQLQGKLNENNLSVKVINRGVSGDTSSDALERVGDIIALKPDVVILAIGLNDAIRRIDPAFTKNNISKIIEELKANNIKIVFCGMRVPARYGLKYSDNFKSLYADLVDDHEVVFMPYFLKGVMLNPKMNISDGMHPNKDGYRLVVDNLYPYLLDALKEF